ncbi:uncharacterized protein TNCV_1012781 [Trichonephila clavipes]|uniref:Uncharacterized protein n=1 Tax=Trichonephila clavipes TaxID=2585209 RepID=A0A8X7BB30_TRICX|nr:uncharacterized protein TNCV_1012781 [Trichonephila clavipes]
MRNNNKSRGSCTSGEGWRNPKAGWSNEADALAGSKRGSSSADMVAEWSRYRIVAGLVTNSSPVPLKTRRVGQRCTLNLSRAQAFSRWCGVVVRRGGASSGTSIPANLGDTGGDSITHRTDRNPTTATRISIQWDAQGHTERHAGSLHSLPGLTPERTDKL